MEKKKVLIVCSLYSPHVRHIVNELLATEKVTVDLFCEKNSWLESENEIQAENVYSFKYYYIIRYLNTLLTIFNVGFVFFKIKKKYDYIEFHYPNIILILPQIFYKLKAIKAGVCIWGDDLKLMSVFYSKYFKYFSKNLSYILTANSKYQKILQETYRIPKEKIYFFGFGSHILTKLKNTTNTISEAKSSLQIPSNSIVITCGHNAAKRQNHLLILDALQKIDKKIYNNLFLLIPLTYPLDNDYNQLIKEKAETLQIPYKIITGFIADEEIVNLRLVSDILIHMQESDSFSGAMSELFYTGNIVINGEWLHYDEIIERGGFYIKTSKLDLVMKLDDVLYNFDLYKTKSIANKQIIWDLRSWETNITKWTQLYK